MAYTAGFGTKPSSSVMQGSFFGNPLQRNTSQQRGGQGYQPTVRQGAPFYAPGGEMGGGNITGITPRNIFSPEQMQQADTGLRGFRAAQQGSQYSPILDQLSSQMGNDIGTNFARQGGAANVDMMFQGNVAKAQAENQWANLMQNNYSSQLGSRLAGGNSVLGLLQTLTGGF